jgi:hypothetical protein
MSATCGSDGGYAGTMGNSGGGAFVVTWDTPKPANLIFGEFNGMDTTFCVEQEYFTRNDRLRSHDGRRQHPPVGRHAD